MSTEISLIVGPPSTDEKLGDYFRGLSAAEASGLAFPAELEDVWRISYSRKDVAVRSLTENFIENVDYQIFHPIAENAGAGRPAAQYRLTLSCLEFLVVRANRPVFDVYRAGMAELRRQHEARQQVPQDFATALRLLADNVEKVAEQQRHLDGQRAQLLEQAPKVALANQIAKATNSVSFAEAAKMLKLPGVSGRNTLFTLLRTDGILRQNREPYQRYVDAGYFEVEGQVYEPGKKEEKGTHGTRIAVTTRLTGKGLTWLTGRYAVGTSIVII